MLGRAASTAHNGVAIALPVLCQCLYGEATLHVLRLYDTCGQCGERGWHGALRTNATCIVVDLSLHHVIQ